MNAQTDIAVSAPEVRITAVSTPNLEQVVAQDLARAPASGVLILVGILVSLAAALYVYLVIEAVQYGNPLAADWAGRASVAVLLALGGGTLLASTLKGVQA